MSASRVALLSAAACQEHETGNHPENAARLDAIDQALETSGLRERLQRPAVTPATTEQVQRIHDQRYVKQVERIAVGGGGALDWDTIIAPGSYRAALAAAGCAITAVDVVMTGQARSAFALVRPPGHHARPGRGMGFCLFNNITIAAQHACDSYHLQRVLIADFDAHHGNGTQEAFYSTEQVLYFSTHLSPFYPGTGHMDDTGSGAGMGYTVNVPLPAGTDDAGLRRAYEEILVPVAERYHPQLVLVSAGYDIHWRDPLTELGASVAGTARLVSIIRAIADQQCDGRLALVLEGGYDLPALAASSVATFRVLLGDEQDEDALGPAPDMGPDISDVIADVRAVHGL